MSRSFVLSEMSIGYLHERQYLLIDLIALKTCILFLLTLLAVEMSEISIGGAVYVRGVYS